MDRGEIKRMQEDIKVQGQLKRFISNPEDFDFSYGHAVNDYQDDMHRFSLHAHRMLRDMIVTHARYIVQKIDDDLKSKGVTE